MEVGTSRTGNASEATRLTASLHQAQAQGLFRDPSAVRHLLSGIAGAITRTVEGNARDPEAAWALRSQVYWDHFEMDIKEAVLGACAGLDPSLRQAAHTVIETTVSTLKKTHHLT